MGFEVHLTRRGYWSDEDGPEIPRAEWLAAVAADAELEVIDEHDARIRGTAIELWWNGERVSIKHPDVRGVRKLVELADRLRARVQDDDGHFYTQADLDRPPLRWWQKIFARGR